MAFEPVYSYSAFDCLKRLAGGQAVVEARLLPEGGKTIAHVLSVSADVSVTPGEVFAGEARYAGRVNFRVLYADGEGAMQAMTAVADFTDKLTADCLSAGMRPVMCAQVLDTDITTAREDEVRLACVAEVELFAPVSEQVKCLTAGGENVYTHDDRIDYCTLAGTGSGSLIVEDSVTEKGVLRYLMSEPRAVVLRKTAGQDMVTVEGSIVTDICCAAEDGSMVGLKAETPFSYEVEVAASRTDYIPCVRAHLTASSVDAETDGENSTQFNLRYTVDVSAAVYGEAVVNPIVDAFCVSNELISTGNSVTVCCNRPGETVNERVEGSVTLDESMPVADNIYAVTACKLGITRAAADDGKLTLEGMASCNVIYFCMEKGSKNSALVELPFSVTVSAPVESCDKIYAHGIVTSVAAKLRRGNEIDIKADISVEYECVREQVCYVISDLKMGEERPLPEGAIAIHIARAGETLWDVAKALASTPEAVLLQNPELTLPLCGGERVISYRHLKQ